MSSRTSRFGLDWFDRAAPGSLSDNGGKFTGRDRQLIDKLLSAFEVHDHGDGERLADPSAAPTVALETAGGSLPAGETYYYRVSYVDQYGLETAAGAEVSVTTPSPVSAPGVPGVAGIEATAATPPPGLDPGQYFYGLTYLTADGNETTLSPPALVTLQAPNNAVRITIVDAIPAGVTQIGIWRQGPLDSGFTKIDTVSASGFTSYEDDGSIASDPCPTDPEKLPPDTNETNATNKVTVTLPAADIAAPTLVERWRVYRSTTQGNYPAASLIAEVVETDGSGALVDEYVDDGTVEPIAGAPLELSQTLLPSSAVSGGGGGVGGQVFLNDSGGTTWRIYASGSGVIVTEALSTAVETDPGFALEDVNGVPWRLTVGIDGALVTTQAEALEGERTFQYGTGPHLPTSDASLSWRMGVGTDGALETFGDLERANRIYLEERDEPATPSSGGVLWVNDAGQLCFKNPDGTVHTIAG